MFINFKISCLFLWLLCLAYLKDEKCRNCQFCSLLLLMEERGGFEGGTPPGIWEDWFHLLEDPTSCHSSSSEDCDRQPGSLTLLSLRVHAQRKGHVCKPGSRPSPGTESASTLILDSPGFRTIRNKCPLFKPPTQWHFVIVAQSD